MVTNSVVTNLVVTNLVVEVGNLDWVLIELLGIEEVLVVVVVVLIVEEVLVGYFKVGWGVG